MTHEHEPQAPRTLRRARRLGEPRPSRVAPMYSAVELAALARRRRARVCVRLASAALLFALAFLPALPARGPKASPELLAALGVADEITRQLDSMNPHLAASRVARIREAVLRSSARYGLDPLLVTAVIEVESSFRPEARSRLGALGLMQVMPHMFRVVHIAGNPATLESNIEAGCSILAGNIRRLGESDGISAYFWGSRIRGTRYLERVLAARARMHGAQRS